MEPSHTGHTPSRSPVWSFLLDTAISTLIPLVVYQISRRYFGASELVGLLCAMLYPLAKSAFDLREHRTVNPAGVLVILGILTGVGALLLGGSPRVLLIRESLLTAAVGVACFISFALPKPLMFYFGRSFVAGNDPVRVAEFNASWVYPRARFAHRLITAVWGCALLGEFAFRTWMVFHFSTTTVLTFSPILFNATILVTMLWTMAYAKRARAAGERARAARAAAKVTPLA
jgi:hypothetical protein